MWRGPSLWSQVACWRFVKRTSDFMLYIFQVGTSPSMCDEVVWCMLAARLWKVWCAPHSIIHHLPIQLQTDEALHIYLPYFNMAIKFRTVLINRISDSGCSLSSGFFQSLRMSCCQPPQCLSVLHINAIYIFHITDISLIRAFQLWAEHVTLELYISAVYSNLICWRLVTCYGAGRAG